MKGNIFISGVGKGLGRELLCLFAEQGYTVFGLLRNKDQTDDLAMHVKKMFVPVIADLNAPDLAGSIKSIVKDHPLCLLINNAGISGRSSKLRQVKGSDLMDVFEVHCVGALRLCQCLIDNLLLADAPAIININSRMGSISEQYKGTYAHLTMNYEYRIAKAAQNMLSACIKNEYKEKIKIFQVHPGRMKTNLSQSDADLDPASAARNIFTSWSQNKLREGEGIIDSQENIILGW